jgi:molybdopterin converting factor small subunit
MNNIRVKLPAHLRTMAGVESEVEVAIEGPITIRTVLDAVEAAYPMLKGTMRDHATKERRAYLRYFACKEDLSHEPMDTPLPDEVVKGKEPFWVIGAIAGG